MTRTQAQRWMRFRKKPVIVEAVLYMPGPKLPKGVCIGDKNGRCILPPKKCFGFRMDEPHIHTLEGVMNVSVGDFIVRGIEGELYPCKPGIFHKTYELAP